MRNRFMVWAALLITAMYITGCSSQGGEKTEANAGVKAPVAVETTAAALSEIVQGVEVVGTLAPKFEADVKSEYLGIVTEVYVTEWVPVKKGTPLAALDTREAERALKRLEAGVELARANLLEAETAAVRADREYERSLKLKEYGLITQQSLDDAATGKAAAQARINAARALIRAAEEELKQGETRLSKSVIRSPMDGVVSLRGVNVGDLAGEVGTPRVMFRIVDNRLLDLVMNVPSHETGAVKVGQPVIFSTDAAPGKTFQGRIKFINPAVNESDRSVKVTAEVPNEPGELKGGLFVRGRIVTERRSGVLQAPRTALASWDVDGRTGELFVAEGNVARLRRVKTGAVSGDMVEIREGLAAGEMIIGRGNFNVRDGDPLKIIGRRGDS